jgi:hypothetical protein
MGLLSKATGTMLREAPVSFNKTPPSEYEVVDGLPGELKNEIIKYCNTYTSVHGIVLTNPEKRQEEAGEDEPFYQQVNRIVAALGSAVPLPSRHILVLFSNTIDPDLLAHRLSNSLETKALRVFRADTVETVVNQIRPYL